MDTGPTIKRGLDGKPSSPSVNQQGGGFVEREFDRLFLRLKKRAHIWMHARSLRVKLLLSAAIFLGLYGLARLLLHFFPVSAIF